MTARGIIAWAFLPLVRCLETVMTLSDFSSEPSAPGCAVLCRFAHHSLDRLLTCICTREDQDTTWFEETMPCSDLLLAPHLRAVLLDCYTALGYRPNNLL